MNKTALIRKIISGDPTLLNNKTTFAKQLITTYPELFPNVEACRSHIKYVARGLVKKEEVAMEKWVVITDTHAPKQDEPAFNATLQYIKDAKPDGILHLGDVGEFESVSHWQEKKRLLAEGQRLSKDISEACALLSRVSDQVINKTKKIVVLGNHDGWVGQYMESHPAMSDSTEFDLTKRFSSLGWTVIPEHGYYRLGHLLCKHAIRLRCGMYHTKQALLNTGKSCLYGHVHDHQTHTVEQWDGPIIAMSSGCLCNTNPKFLKGESNRWIHGLSTVFVHPPTGMFDIYFSRIIKGAFVSINGKFYQG